MSEPHCTAAIPRVTRYFHAQPPLPMNPSGAVVASSATSLLLLSPQSQGFVPLSAQLGETLSCPFVRPYRLPFRGCQLSPSRAAGNRAAGGLRSGPGSSCKLSAN
ncbi:hypothetical protein XELAEV_18037672mg [Xenopus laevis]|uniref:Uncharacterized protein n=1 Tax=Xenopus laevis TaxID=8355 RepID=A0A974CCR3_XENLA|nr:hypothetical protein XELAEV_18037672mg [Xenopus laevis]